MRGTPRECEEALAKGVSWLDLARNWGLTRLFLPDWIEVRRSACCGGALCVWRPSDVRRRSPPRLAREPL